MGAFSVMISDEKIIKATAGIKRLIILGCLGCANDSLALEKGVPLAKISIDPKTGNIALSSLAMMAEVNRLKAVLEGKGIKVAFETAADFCRYSNDFNPEDTNWVKSCGDHEAVVALCCAGGMVGIKRILNREIKIVPGMKTSGTIFSYVVCDKASGLAYLDKNKSAAVRSFDNKDV